MELKPDARDWTIKEQILEDPVTGLTFQFEAVPDDLDAPFRLKIFWQSAVWEPGVLVYPRWKRGRCGGCPYRPLQAYMAG